MDTKDHAALRIRLPEELDEQTLRSTLDRALQLIAGDLSAACSKEMAKKYGPNWHANDFDGKHTLQATDPTFWVKEFKLESSPGHAIFPESRHAISSRMVALNGLRNALYHFHQEFTPDSAHDRLHDLGRLAQTMQLPCHTEIETARVRMCELRDGVRPSPSTVEEGLTLLAENERLRAQLTTEKVAKEQTENELEVATEKLTALTNSLESVDAQPSERTQELEILEQEVERLEKMASAHALLLVQLEERAATRSASEPAALPATAERAASAFLQLSLHASQIFGLLTTDNSPGHQHEALAQIDYARGRVMAIAHHVPSIDASGVVSDDPKDLLERDLATLDEAVRRARTWVLDAPDAEQFAAGQASLLLEVVESGAQSIRNAVASLTRPEEWPARRPETANAGARAPDSKLAEPGSEWSWPPGDDIWVLSIRSRRLRRPRTSDVGEFTATYGDDLEQRLVAEWLAITPTGGRIHLDEDGDACVLGTQGHFLYLGRVPETATT